MTNLNKFRPLKFANFIGQKHILNTLNITIKACQLRSESLYHIILFGKSGMGKTSLAHVIASEIQSKIHLIHARNIAKPSDIIGTLTRIKEYDIVFIDEVHALPVTVQEILYPVLEDNNLEILVGKSYNAKNIQIKLPKFTLISATTKQYALTKPFINRFPLQFYLDDYSTEDIARIISLHANRLNLNWSQEVIAEIAKYCRFNPRIALNILQNLYNYCLLNNTITLTINNIVKILSIFNVYQDGLTFQELSYLKNLYQYFKTNYVGLDVVAQSLSLSKNVIKNTIEPYLLQMQYLEKSHQGRRISEKSLVFLENLGK